MVSNNNNSKQKELEVLNRIQTNWATLTGLVNRLENAETKESLNELCEKLHDRFAVCPASSKLEYIGSFPGGLAWHSLNVLKIMKDLRKSFDLENSVPTDSLIVLGLFHDIGKLGNEEEDYFYPQTSEWHRKTLGQVYEINKELVGMPVAIRSLWWLNNFGVQLSENEIGALTSLATKPNEEISFVPSLRVPWETFLLQTAVRASCMKYAGFSSIADVK